jgi:FkbM family methyltransferase
MSEPLPVEKELKSLFPGNATITIFDIGACEAEDSIKYSRLFPASTIYAFEPLAANVRLANANVKNYNITNVRLVEKALSDKNGPEKFYVSSGHPADAGRVDWDFGNKSSSLLEPGKHQEFADFIKFETVVNVETTRLDSFCQQNNISVIDFIHMDVQGAELMILHGAGAMIRSIKAIWLEVSTVDLFKGQPLAGDIEKFMTANGFVMVRDCLYGISGDRLYVSKVHVPKYRRIFPRWTRRRSLLRKVLRKAGL